MVPKVIVLGGGIAGMSAAHELVKRGYDVEVFERRSLAGGKARSLPVIEPPGDAPPSGNGKATTSPSRRGQKPWLPGEHGFRFFPRFYQHVVDTMQGIPYQGGNVADNLVDTTRVQVARFDRPSFFLPARFPHTAGDFQTILHTALGVLSGAVGIPVIESARFAMRLWQIFTSCEERRLTEYEKISWWDFIDAENASEAYKRVFGHGITRSLVAAKARRASTKTIGNIFTQIVFDILRPGVSADRVLNGPTNDVWIDPWLEHLRREGVRYHLDAEVIRINCVRGVIRSATINVAGREREVAGDYFIGAVPVERMADLLSPEMLSADPSLASIEKLKDAVEWMNGIQFYLTEDIPIVHGHTIYLDSPWAITSISQPQFWRDYDLGDYGDGKVRGIISVDISNWNVRGLNGKTARECSRDEVAHEVWDQLKRSLNFDGRQLIRDEQLHYWFLDADIEYDNPARPGTEVNTEPLLVNYVDTWRLRPEAVTRIPNFFLAGDYVRTTTDLATMESANEAARRAVNGVLTASRSSKDPCQLWNFHEPEALAAWRAYDRVRWRQGLPWDARLTGPAGLLLSLADKANACPANSAKGGDATTILCSLRKKAGELAGIAYALVGAHGTSQSDTAPTPVTDLPSLEMEQEGGTPPRPAPAVRVFGP